MSSIRILIRNCWPTENLSGSVCVSAGGNRGRGGFWEEVKTDVQLCDIRARFLFEFNSPIVSPCKAATAGKFKDDLMCASL
jgi:hypothetical protein